MIVGRQYYILRTTATGFLLYVFSYPNGLKVFIDDDDDDNNNN